MSDGGNVVLFPGVTVGDLDADAVLESAKGSLSEVLVLGLTEDGEEYFAGSHADAANALWLLERMKHLLLRSADE